MQSAQHLLKILRQRALKLKILLRRRMNESQHACMEHLSLCSLPVLRRAVELVTEKRMLDVCHVDTYLMSSSRFEFCLNQSEIAESL